MTATAGFSFGRESHFCRVFSPGAREVADQSAPPRTKLVRLTNDAWAAFARTIIQLFMEMGKQVRNTDNSLVFAICVGLMLLQILAKWSICMPRVRLHAASPY